MIKHSIMEAEGILVLEPQSALAVEDFRELAADVDAYLEKNPTLHGLLIHAKSFPGWDSFAGFAAHIKFVREHHKKVKRIAIVTDSPLGSVGPALAKHFVAAEIKRFAYAEYDAALDWLKQS